jgi:hypothetical protein
MNEEEKHEERKVKTNRTESRYVDVYFSWWCLRKYPGRGDTSVQLLSLIVVFTFLVLVHSLGTDKAMDNMGAVTGNSSR